jgi:DNA-directed RNA polymerase specialized sigma24 family protein
LLERNDLAVAQPERGRFRAFLLTAFKHFLANEWEKASAQKRGGGRAPIALDFETGESRFTFEPAVELTPERLFDRQWALTLLDHVLSRVRASYVSAGKEVQFEQLKPFLAGPSASEAYTEPARALGMSEGAVKVAVHRLRRRYRELLREETAQIVSGRDEIEDEIRSLFAALGS